MTGDGPPAVRENSMNRVSSLTLAFGLITLIAGCNEQGSKGSVAENVLISRPASTPESSGIRGGAFRDLGVLSPGQRVQTEFTISNSSSRVWTVSNVAVSCSCTVAEISNEVIGPETQASVIVEYHASDEPTDQRQTILLSFREEGVEPIPLELSARVRAPLTASVKTICFDEAGMIDRPVRTVLLTNWTEDKWQSVELEGNAPWLRVKLREVPPNTVSLEDPAPLQAWKARIEVVSDNLTPADANANCVLKFWGARGSARPSASVYVSAFSEPPIVVEPKSLYFGKVSRDSRPSAQVRLRVRRDVADGARGNLRVEHDYGAAINAHLVKTSRDGEYDLIAQLESRVGADGSSPELKIMDQRNKPIATVPIIIFEEE